MIKKTKKKTRIPVFHNSHKKVFVARSTHSKPHLEHVDRNLSGSFRITLHIKKSPNPQLCVDQPEALSLIQGAVKCFHTWHWASSGPSHSPEPEVWLSQLQLWHQAASSTCVPNVVLIRLVSIIWSTKPLRFLSIQSVWCQVGNKLMKKHISNTFKERQTPVLWLLFVCFWNNTKGDLTVTKDLKLPLFSAAQWRRRLRIQRQTTALQRILHSNSDKLQQPAHKLWLLSVTGVADDKTTTRNSDTRCSSWSLFLSVCHRDVCARQYILVKASVFVLLFYKTIFGVVCSQTSCIETGLIHRLYSRIMNKKYSFKNMNLFL